MERLEAEKLENLFRMLKREMESRKKLFAGMGGSFQDYIRLGGGILPNIVVVLSNYAAFYEMYGSEYEDVFILLAREGVKYGIYFIITASNANAVKYKTAQNFKSVYVLQLNDQSDYASVIGATGGVYPSKIKGRGLIKLDNIYEFQTAHAFRDTNQILDQLNRYCEEAIRLFDGRRAKPVPVLPDRVTADFLKNDINGCKELTVGIERKNLTVEAVRLPDNFIFIAYSLDQEQITRFGQGLSETAALLKGVNITVLDPQKSFLPDSERQYQYIDTEFEEIVNETFHEVAERHNECKALGDERAEKFQPKIYIMVLYHSLQEALTPDGKEKLELLLDRGRAPLRINFFLLDTKNSTSSYNMSRWYKKHVTGDTGLWIGDGFQDQHFLKAARSSSDFYKEIGPDFGYLLKNGKYKVVKSLTTRREISAEEGKTDDE